MAGSYLHKMAAAAGKSVKKMPKTLHKFIKRQLKDERIKFIIPVQCQKIHKYARIYPFHRYETQFFIPRIEHMLWLKKSLSVHMLPSHKVLTRKCGCMQLLHAVMQMDFSQHGVLSRTISKLYLLSLLIIFKPWALDSQSFVKSSDVSHQTNLNYQHSSTQKQDTIKY